ncbi:uncharacterized protein TRIVIDRAFT_213142 [Trichoderma virens Gv29-8]|uniref:C2H2-type domain-containing protein n=1 Tax=Hypocrea virens (strain Gv29-8 / FGSC 10586) TaxID=413071 RepID=G9MVS6_HYPVG|nr:uncharacterized protein TRIVIDRAFT_213142 [Trichoderma virens Gv29-8]EHK21401.1 hypothetical protein TRIVIDRAFT_213142 [Trichoderma virens Gv29-8]
MENYAGDNSFSDILANTGMSPDLTFIDVLHGNLDDVGNSSTASFDDNLDDAGNSFTASFDDPSSDVGPNGEYRQGYRWCCGKLRKDDGNFKKHLNTHNKDLPCEADSPYCSDLLFADNKARNRHYLTAHKKYAKEKGIEDTSCSCKDCNKSFSRQDNFRRHVNKHHSQKFIGEGGKPYYVLYDKYEEVKGEDGYAWVCRLKSSGVRNE